LKRGRWVYLKAKKKGGEKAVWIFAPWFKKVKVEKDEE